MATRRSLVRPATVKGSIVFEQGTLPAIRQPGGGMKEGEANNNFREMTDNFIFFRFFGFKVYTVASMHFTINGWTFLIRVIICIQLNHFHFC